MKFQFEFMKVSIYILLFSLLSSSVFAQYSIEDSALVRTTFQREFDKEIIYNYLSSKDSKKVNAALLSISHSEDTTFVDSIINLDFYKYGEFVTFALGELGQSKLSEEYLLLILRLYENPYSSECFDALGKCGDSLTLEYIFDSDIIDYLPYSIGFPLAISNYYSRGITNDNSLSYLANNSKKIKSFGGTCAVINDSKQLGFWMSDNLLYGIAIDTKALNTFYALNRLGSTEEAIPELEKFANDDFYYQTKLYVLSNFRKLKYFPEDIALLQKLIASDSWRIRVETANSACYYPFTTNDEVSTYLTLLDDINPNVSRTAATALKNINFSKDRKYLKSQIENYLNNVDLTQNTKGELLISYASLFNIKIENVIDNYSEIVESKFIYRSMAQKLSDWDFQYDYLEDRIEDSSEIELIDMLPAYLALQNKFINDKEYAAHLFKVFQSEKPSSVSIIADGLKLPMIHHYRGILQELIVEQIFKIKNNPQFAETIIALTNLSYKIDRVFYDSVIEMLSTSSINSVKKYASEKLGIEFSNPIDDKLFSKLWKSAFKYKFAKIETNKGTFTIQLKPEFAPITCGSFISLAEKGFYNGVLFHRVVPDFVIQTGDTTSTGWGGPGYEIVSEFSPLPFQRGAVGVASIGKDTEGSQWFVMHSNFPHLNGNYTNWASVISGMNVVDTIDESDRIISISLK